MDLVLVSDLKITQTQPKQKGMHKLQNSLLLFFGPCMGLIAKYNHNWEWSCVVTLGQASQALAMAQVLLRLLNDDHVGPISFQMLIINTVAIAARLVPTSIKDGYVPVDLTGNWLAQSFDAAALLCSLGVLWMARSNATVGRNERRWLAPVVLLVSLGVAVRFHPHLDKSDLYNVSWMAGQYAFALAQFAQLLHLKFSPLEDGPIPWECAIPSLVSILCASIFWMLIGEELNYDTSLKFVSSIPGEMHLATMVMFLMFTVQWILLNVWRHWQGRAKIPGVEAANPQSQRKPLATTSCDEPDKQANRWCTKQNVLLALFLPCIGLIWGLNHAWDLSSSMVDIGHFSLAFALGQVLVLLVSNSCVGALSVQVFYVMALAFPAMFASTTFAAGYIPEDRSGNWFTQACDAVAWLLVLGILRAARGHKMATHRECCWLAPVLLLLSIGLGLAFHSNMDDEYWLDVCWAAGMFALYLAPVLQLLRLHCASPDDGPLSWVYGLPLVLGFFGNIYFWFLGHELLFITSLKTGELLSSLPGDAMYVMNVVCSVLLVECMILNACLARQGPRTGPEELEEPCSWGLV